MPLPEIDWPNLTDAELAEVRDALDAEQARRYMLVTAPAALERAAQASPEAVRDQVRDQLGQIRDRLNRRSARG